MKISGPWITSSYYNNAIFQKQANTWAVFWATVDGPYCWLDLISSCTTIPERLWVNQMHWAGEQTTELGQRIIRIWLCSLQTCLPYEPWKDWKSPEKKGFVKTDLTQNRVGEPWRSCGKGNQRAQKIPGKISKILRVVNGKQTVTLQRKILCPKNRSLPENHSSLPW